MTEQTDKDNVKDAGVAKAASSSAGKDASKAAEAAKAPEGDQTGSADKPAADPAGGGVRSIEDIAKERGVDLDKDAAAKEPLKDPQDRREAAVREADRRDHQHGEDHRTPEQIADDRAMEARRDQNQRPRDPSLGAPIAAPIPGNADSIARQHAEVDAAKDRLNEHNEAGHEVNMEAAERQAAEAQGKTNHPGYHVPTGKEDNRNTPVVNPDGSKVWK